MQVDLIKAVLGPVLVLGATLSGPALAAWVLGWRRRRARERRRSPIGIQLLRPPGHALREQIDDRIGDVMAYLAVLMAVPPMMLAVVFLQMLLIPQRSVVGLAVIGGLAVLGLIGWSLRQLWKTGQALDNLRAGLDAEMAVGQELDQLMRRGAYVFHDIPGENFNIDHVVAAREGVFVIETKGYTKPNRDQGRADAKVTYDGQRLAFPTFATRDPIDQAERNAKWMARELSASTGEPVTTVPVLALPGWFVERQGRGAVRVYNGRELAGLLDTPRTTALSAEQLQRVAHQLEQRCRSVVPTYSRKPAD